MVIVEIRPGCFVRMRPEDAASRGLTPAPSTKTVKASQPEAAKTPPETVPDQEPTAEPAVPAVEEPRKARKKAAADD